MKLVLFYYSTIMVVIVGAQYGFELPGRYNKLHVTPKNSHTITVCPDDEILVECVAAVCGWKNCGDIFQEPLAICPQTAPVPCPKGCLCKSGSLRDEHGDCIPKEKCDKYNA